MFDGIVAGYQMARRHRFQRRRLGSTNLTHSNRCIFSLPGIATQSICAGLLGILREILPYGIGGLFAPLNLFLLCLTEVCQT
jgi:hypothetical protein